MPKLKIPSKRGKPGGVRPESHPRMTDDVRAEIVMRLAMYDTVADIQADLRARGIEITHQAIGAYNAETNGARRIAKRWVDLFHATREQWLKEIAAEPIANRAFRLRRLTEILNKAMKRGDLARAQGALEQAAKEVGNVFTNVSKVQGTALPGQVPVDRTPEENRNILIDRLTEALAKLPKKSGELTKH